MNDALGMNFLGGEQRKSDRIDGGFVSTLLDRDGFGLPVRKRMPSEIESQLTSEDASRSGAGAVALVDAIFENVLKKIEIGSQLIPDPTSPTKGSFIHSCAAASYRTPDRGAVVRGSGRWQSTMHTWESVDSLSPRAHLA